MKSKLTLLLLVLCLAFSTVVSAQSSEEHEGLSKEQKATLAKNQKEMKKILKENGYDLDSDEAKEILLNAYRNDLFNFNLLNEETSSEKDQVSILDESVSYKTPGLIWYTPADIKGVYTGHTGTVNNNTSYTTEAFPDSGVVRQSNNWPNRAGYTKVYALGVYGANSSTMSSAATYAENQKGKAYNYDFSYRMKTTQFYCSQLSWRAYYEQGINLHNDGRTFGTVYPSDIYESTKTFVVFVQ
jgi:uncharacterized protein YycO